MKRVISCAAVALMFVYASSVLAQDTIGPREWRQFRDAYPYHIQGVAVSNPRADGSRVVIVAEPPPHVDRRALSAIFAGAVVQYPAQPIGPDGWVRDAVAVISAERASTVAELVDALHREMFGTTYKAFALPIEPARTAASVDATALDLQASAADLSRWLLPTAGAAGQRALRFTRLGSSTAVSAREILDRALPGVFLSSEPGLVLCAVSSSTPLANARVDLRRFVLDSDLILGAVKKGTHVVIVGRERVAPVTVLPPLRVETILQLASVGQDELSQSYERRNIIAGRYDETHDWAPIYLSAALLDTEYGSLLNITDQLLKSWSMRGLVHYDKFPYPVPAKGYPFDVPLPEYVKARRVTFNWNTKGAGYVLAKAGVNILALNRTGALPVDYLGGEDARITEAEDKAYEHFSGIGDPNLVRVVQYAGLYQIFRRYGISTPLERPLPPIAVPRAARAGAAAVVGLLRKFDTLKIAELIREASTGPKPNVTLADALRRMLSAKLAIEALFETGGDPLLTHLIEALAAPRDFRQSGPNGQAVLATAQKVMAASLQQLLDLPLKPIKEQYVADSARRVEGWIRTPSIVVSWMERPDGRAGEFVGGHNLSARTSSMSPDATVPPGGVRIVVSQGRRQLLFNPVDEPKIASLVRRFGRGEEKPMAALEAELRTTLRSAVAVERPLADVLVFRTGPVGTRGLDIRHLPAGVAQVGWRYTDVVPNARQVETIRALADPQSAVWVLERAGNGTLSIYSEGARPVLTAGNTVSCADALADLIRTADPQRGPIRLHVRGLDTNQARGVIQSVETRLSPEQRGRLAGTVEHGLLGPRDLRRVMAADYDFARARVDRVSDAIRDAEGTRFEMEVTVPARLVDRPSIMMRFKLLFRSVFALPAQLKASAERLVHAWTLGIDAGLSPGALGAAKQRLRTDLKSVHRELDVDIVIDDTVLITRYLNALVDAIAAAA